MTGTGLKLVRGMTLLIPGTGPASAPQKGHLFVVLTETCSLGMNLLVPICSSTTKHDQTCELAAGEHPFLDRPSYVGYNFLQTQSVVFISARHAKKMLFTKEPMESAVLEKICDGVAKSSFSSPRLKKYFADNS